MKGSSRKYAARRVCFTIPFLAILLFVSPAPAKAGLLDSVNNKVTIILNKVKSIASNTNGLQDFITTLRDIRGSLGSGMISDMRETVGETQDLIQFIKDRRESAGQASQYPSLHVLVESLGNVSGVVTNREGQSGALESLSALLAVLPDKALAPVAKAISRAGIDGDFVFKIDQMATDLVELRNIIDETTARRDAATRVAGDVWVDGDGLLIAEFECHIRGPAQLVRLSRTARSVKKIAETMKVLGALIDATNGAITIEKGAGIWGWVSVDVKTDAKGATGKLLVILADAVLVIVDSAQNIIDTCKDQYVQQAQGSA